MKFSLLAIALLSVALVACDRNRTVATPADPNAAPPVADQPAADVPPATTPDSAPPESASPPVAATGRAVDLLARYDGYGDMRLGMTAEQVKKAWTGELSGVPAEGEACFHLSPKQAENQAEFALMIENDKFVRYGTESEKYEAPGGGRVGMSAMLIRGMYSGRIEELKHKYVDGGQYLRIKDAGSDGVLLFETDAAGTVTEWRVGVPPQVDYVEGCS